MEGLDIGEHGMEAYPGFGTDYGTSGEVPELAKTPAKATAPAGVPVHA
jgi:hypothetical protein